jgi:hypothetical protein
VHGQVGAFGQILAQQPVVFSFDPRCQGLCGGQKYTGMPVAMVKSAW